MAGELRGGKMRNWDSFNEAIIAACGFSFS